MAAATIARDCEQQRKNNGKFEEALDDALKIILEQAKEIKSDRKALGDTKVASLLDKCDTTMRKVIDTWSENQAFMDSLQEVSSSMDDGTSPQALKIRIEESFGSGKARRSAAGDQLYESHPAYKKLKSVVSEAGTSTEVDDEGVQMTQQVINNFKCPILQMDMSEKGDMRPMYAPSCGNTRCIFSYAGIKNHFGGGRGAKPCPSAGCSNTFTLQDVQEHREWARKIRAAAQASQMDD